jgi:hydroxymethylglutaryl-CoA lyase
VAFINALSQTGVDEIEVSAFVSPVWVPQLADAAEVFQQINRNEGIVYSALVPNEQGLERAIEARVDKIAVFTAASETFNRKNINATINESIARFVPVLKRAVAERLPVRGYLSTAFWCPYEGRIAPAKVVEVARKLDDLGVQEFSIGDTIGSAKSSEVEELLDLLLKSVSADRLAMHFHDTHGQALDNVVAAWKLGITAFDGSAGGLGGCPYAPGAPGNVATESLVERLTAEGAETRADREALRRASQILASHTA